MIPQCRGCGKVRWDGMWQRRDDLYASYMGWCDGGCMERHLAAERRLYAEAARRKVNAPANPRAGEHEDFRGFVSPEPIKARG